METIEIAPSLDNVTLEKNVVSTTFAGMKISYTMPEEKCAERKPDEIRQALRDGIAISSKLWFLEDLLNRHFDCEGKLLVTDEETGRVLYN